VNQFSMLRNIICGRNKNVIHINDDLACCSEIHEFYIHESLKNCWCILKTEGHDCVFVKSHIGFEGCFVFVAFPYSDVVVSRAYIHFGEDPCLTDFVH
jgi:hypothetical protein